MFLPVHVALPLVAAGKLNMLAAGGTQRDHRHTRRAFAERSGGVRDIDTDIWYGLYVPARTPPAIVGKLNRTMNTLLKNPGGCGCSAKAGFAAYRRYAGTTRIEMTQNRP